MSQYNIYRFKTIKVFFRDEFRKSEFIVTGFKGFGAVGYLASLHLAERPFCKKAGFIVTKYVPEEITPGDEGVVGPFTLYSCENNSRHFGVIVNHDIPLVQERSRFAEAIINFLTRMGISEAILIGGFDSRLRRGDEKLRWIATSAYKRNLDEPRMDKGLYVVGPLALLLLYAEVYGYPALALLPYAEAARPDPRAAAVAIEKLNKLYGLSIGTEELLEEAKKIEEMISTLERQQQMLSSSAPERSYM
ncbi:MAG: PAC2 family protein [Desulfurococcales archaeon]|nr:PAC2 family protein [Desulfurococcales archaeon]